MNIDFNKFLKFFIPLFIISVFAYIVNIVLFFLLPKNGVDYIEKTTHAIPYIKVDITKAYDLYPKKPVQKKLETKVVSKPVKQEYQLLSNIILKAIYATANQRGWIIVAERNSKKTHILEIGEKFKEYKLIKVYENYVIFKMNSKEYKLSMKKEENNVKYEVLKKETKKSPWSEKIVVDGDNVKVSRKLMNEYVSNLDKVWKNIAIKEIKENGRINGFKVLRMNKNSVFGKLGLQKDDILKSINNIKLKSYNDAFKIYNKINKIDFLNIKILRNGNEMELNYELD